MAPDPADAMGIAQLVVRATRGQVCAGHARDGGYAGGEGPKTLRLTGAHADGTILVGGTSPEELRRARGLIEEGRAEAGRGGHHLITVYLPVATGAGAQARMDANAAHWNWPADGERFVVGDADTVAAAVARWASAGADTVVLQPTEDDPDPEGFVAFAAEVGRLTKA